MTGMISREIVALRIAFIKRSLSSYSRMGGISSGKEKKTKQKQKNLTFLAILKNIFYFCTKEF